MYDILQLNDMPVQELLAIAEQLKIKKAKKLDKQELIYKILDKQDIATKKVVISKIELPYTWARPYSGPYIASESFDEMHALKILIDPGTAPNEEIASLLADLSRIYRQMGGSGIEFKLDSVTLNKEELA